MSNWLGLSGHADKSEMMVHSFPCWPNNWKYNKRLTYYVASNILLQIL